MNSMDLSRVWESSDDCELMGHNRSPYSSIDLFLGIKIMQTKWWSKSGDTRVAIFSRPFNLLSLTVLEVQGIGKTPTI